MFKNILVPLNGSGEGKRVIPFVRDLAPRFGSEVHVLGVGIGNKQRRVNRMLEQYIDEVAGNLDNDDIKAKSVILYGRPADKILSYAEENNINLIIMATRGRGGITRWWLGSVAERVISEAHIPILLIRSRRISKMEAEEKSALLNIITPLDGSNIGETALPQVEVLATATGASINLLQVIASPADVEAKFNSNAKKQTTDLHASGEEYLKNIAEGLNKKGITTKYEVINGDPANVIVDLAGQRKDSIIAMSTHGRSGIARWVLGSVADKVLRASDTPIWLVRSPKMTTIKNED